MMSRTQISLKPDAHRRARARAAARGISLAEYMRRLVDRDLSDEVRPSVDVSVLFDLGNSGGSDIANHKDEYIGDAIAARKLDR
jgi:hypothetical protein